MLQLKEALFEPAVFQTVTVKVCAPLPSPL
jgi:hypothetical protein